MASVEIRMYYIRVKVKEGGFKRKPLTLYELTNYEGFCKSCVKKMGGGGGGLTIL
jgi:hypothetical protein